MAKFSPGNEDLCFTCHLMQECTDVGKLPPCLGVVEPVQQTTNTQSKQAIKEIALIAESIVPCIKNGRYGEAAILANSVVAQLLAL